MATITARRESNSRSIQDMERIEGFSSEPFFIEDYVENVLDFDSITPDADGVTFTEILAYNKDRTGTYNYMTQCNFTSARVFNLASQPLVSPNGFASITLKTERVILNR